MLGLCALFTGQAAAQLGTNSGPISGYHGHPSQCSSCHFGGSYSGTASFTVPSTVPHNTTTTGQAFTFNINTNAPAWGFNIAIYNPSDVKVSGGYSNFDTTVIYSGQTNGELQHYNRQTDDINDDPTFDWTAPSGLSALGTYTIYGCLNQVDAANPPASATEAGDGPPVCNTATFEVINNPPNAVNNLIAITVSEDAVAYSGFVNVLSNDVATEGDAFAWLSDNTAGIQGDLNRSGSSYQYRPNGQFESLSQGVNDDSESFTYTIRETAFVGATDCVGNTPCTDTATVTIRVTGVNDRPVAVDDGSMGSPYVTVVEGMAVDNGTDGDAGNNDLASNDTDVDSGDTLDATRTGCPAGVTGPTNGTITNFGADGTFTYTHDGSETTSDSFTYCTIDSSGTGTSRSSNSATVYIQITGSNDAPTITTSGGNTAFTEQTPVVVDNNLTLMDNDSTEFSGATVQITGGAQAGDQLACGALPAGISCSAPGTTVTLSSATTSPIADYESALEAVTFTSSSDNPALGARTVTFIVEDDLSAFSSVVASAQKTISPINRSNDPPTLAAIVDQNAFEDTGADPYTFTYTAVASDLDVDDDINDGGLSTAGTPTLTYSLSGAPAGMTIENNSPNHGRITWNPPITGYPATDYGPITVLIEDGDEDLSAPNSVSFMVTVSPPDDDGDMVENYNDVCLTVADSTNADNDGDGTPGSDGGVNDGGDVCDLDDDNDGMPDAYELANSFDPFDDTDAAEDADGDGVSNLQEYLDGTNPNLSNLTIDATGYLTPYKLKAPEPTSIHALATAVTANDYGPYRPGDNTITWTPSNATVQDLAASDPGNLVSDPPEQPFFIRPLVNFAVDQQAAENAAVMVTVTLNGDSPSWPGNPATVDYKVSGTADNPQDHNAADGTLTFNDGEYVKTINFMTAADATQDPDETVVFTLKNPVNLALGSRRTHKVTIVEGNIAPQAELQFTQGGDVVGSTYDGDGAITVDALVSDLNGADTHSYDWSGTDNFLVPPGNVASWMIAVPVAGNYLIDLRVTDSGSPAKSTRVTRILRVSDSAGKPVLGATDSDNDGTPDNDPSEGFADDDGDGIPNYLDAIDGNVGGSNLVPDQTVDASESMMLQTESGLRLVRGGTAQAADRFGALVSDRDVKRYGSADGGKPLGASDNFKHVGGIYSFEIRGVVPGESASIVIPLQSGIPKDAEYRKFHAASGWTVFVENDNNRIASAAGEPGACPEAGSKEYRNGLTYLDNCIELTIQDGGPNDTDNRTDGVISDPGTVGVQLTEPQEEEVKDGGGRMSPLLLMTMLMLGGFAAWRRRRRASAARG